MDHKPRLFADDAAIRSIGERMLACTLPKSEWTHEAHLSTCAWLILERPDILPERDLPHLIRRYNESVGGVNDETQGYHETITQVSIRAIRAALARSEGGSLAARVNDLLLAPEGRRDWPLRFYSPDRLFSREARLGWVEPDLCPFPRG
jgi:Uma2 family endonuclease